MSHRTSIGSGLTLEMLISLYRAVPYAAIGMAIWLAMQWYIVRTQDKLWLARESYDIARRKGKA